ncbi:MAG: hypothetical protein A3K19_13590 [Lentisphaerae bacterium RIFOXYB12_FULL_65_16]|nr:MAG: hypothetical protein A3K18_05390 [Lentisphaerae bacterium RIFOXYA12_64_32]OGV93069.1 MAG: hypothetical protein A3K19_13590 [Lentisphaerae bacterium RIFOXYB12_FULL_65_16]
MSFLQSLRDGKFTIVVEFTPHGAAEVKHVASIAKGLPELNRKYADSGIVFSGVSLTQNPGGNASYDHLASLAILAENGFPAELEVMPHVTGKDMNRDALCVLLKALMERGIRTVLAITGDEPLAAQGVFEVDSIGVLEAVKEVGVSSLKSAKNAKEFSALPYLSAGAAVSPFKYTEGSLAMQFIKAAKKIRSGATFLTCQSGWDSQRSELLVKEMGACGVPLIGNCLVVNTAAAKFMQTLPGAVITDAFLAKLKGESSADNLVRAGQQMAMFRALGYGGIDLGKPGEFKSIDEIVKVVDTALACKDWRAVNANLHFPAAENAPPCNERVPHVSLLGHSMVFEKSGSLHGLAKAVFGPFESSAAHEGFLYHLFEAQELWAKGLLYECEACGDCFLTENEYLCTKGGCEKGLPNPPCGDADPKGRCGNNANRICVGERLYYRFLKCGKLDELKNMILPPRMAKLQDTASILNYFFGRDHMAPPKLRTAPFIQIAEMLHASIPFPGAAMRHLQTLGPEGWTRPNRGLTAVEHLIRSQAQEGAYFIDVNIDALNDPEAPTLMRRYVRLVQQISGGVPPCIDSSDGNVLVAGLEEWYSRGKAPAKPMVNSIPFVEMDKRVPVYEMRKKYPFNVVCLLVGPEGPMRSADEMYDAAKVMFRKAREAGFAPDEIYFDGVTLGMSTDGCIGGDGSNKPSHTHNSFHAIKRIKADPEMAGAHAILGVSNWVYGAKKRRIGHLRAFVAVAQKYGLDGGIVDVSKALGVEPAVPELMDFVEMYVSLDGSEDSMTRYVEKMQFMRDNDWV